MPADSAPPITPLPVPPGTRSLVFVGGVFDPPHRAHITLPALARDARAPGAWLVYVPAAQSPHKSGGAHVSDHHRLEMLRLAVAAVPRAGVWSDEVDRAQPAVPSYWIETLERARRIATHAPHIWFVIGADQAAAFHCWRQPLDILAAAEPIVLLRPPLSTPASLLDALRATGAWNAPQLARWERSIVPTPVLPTNATAIREALHHGATGAAEADLDPAVARYIADHHLYAPAQNPRSDP